MQREGYYDYMLRRYREEEEKTAEKKWDYDFLKNMKNMDLFNSRFDSYPGNLEGLTEESIVGIGSVQDWFSKDLEKKNMSYVNIEKKIKKIKNKYNIE